MSFSAKARRLPGRLAAGAFTFDSGLTKWNADEQTAKGLHDMAAGTYPFLAKVKARDFVRMLSVAEIALGSALLLPVVPAGLAGAGLAAFAGGTLGVYLRTPGFTKDGIRPSHEGIALAKDVWLLAIGLELLLDGLTERQASAA
jgi:hypothetical protein